MSRGKMVPMRNLHEPAKDWQPCSVCGRAAPYVHDGERYCVRNECQLVAAGMIERYVARARIAERLLIAKQRRTA